MTTAELLRANELSDELIAKLKQIKAIWAEIPSNEDLQEIGKEAAAIAGSLNEARETYGAKDFPVAHDFDDLDTRLDGIVGSLNEIVEKQAEAASADDFDDLDKKLDGIVGNLNEIVEKQAEVAE